MLPDDYENLAQSIVSTNFFGNNVLQAITTKNYWDVVNEYKPLMHTWYVGILMQYYLYTAFILLLLGSFVKEQQKREHIFLQIAIWTGIVSFILYWIVAPTERFYYLPYRLFEFNVGSVFIFHKRQEQGSRKRIRTIGFIVSYVLLLALLFTNGNLIGQQFILVLAVFVSACLIYLMTSVSLASNRVFSNQWIAKIGAASYSIFVWHQIVFAFTRYSFTKELTLPMVGCSVFLIIFLLSFLSYRYVEKMKITKLKVMAFTFLLMVTTGYSLYIFQKGGVVRDVPELDVYMSDGRRGIWKEYSQRVYEYDKDFTNSSKPKWFVIGNSFGRDFVNVILESEYADSVEVSYKHRDEGYEQCTQRFAKADVVILSTLGLNEELVNDIKSRCNPQARLIIVGEKNYGENNGIIYHHRFESNFHQLTTKMEEGYAERNEKFKALYGNDFIDLIAMASQPNGNVVVFSEDGRFLSQDCHHFTRAGAQYYAKHMDWKKFFPFPSVK